MADILHHATLTTNLISYWSLEETSSTRYDQHGSNHLTDNNTVTRGTGKQGFCADFERTNNEYLTAVDSSTFPHSASGDDISAAMWVNFESLVSWETFIQHYLQTGNQRSWTFYLDGTVLHLDISADGSSDTAATVTWSPSTATWYHIAFTYDVSAGEVKFYVNGAQQGATQTGKPTSYYASTAKLQFGTFYDGSSSNGSFDGLMDEVGLWNKVLTSGEITDLYNSGNGIQYYNSSDATNTEILRPTGAGDETNLQTVTGAATHWEAVDDTGTGDDATTTVGHNTDNVYARDLYATGNSSIGAGTINAVTIYIKHEGVLGYSRVVLKTTSVYERGNVGSSADDTWEYSKFTYKTNPNSGNAWTWAEVDAMQIGVGNFRAPTEQGRITQVYAEIDYTPSTSSNFFALM